ncbi:MAG: DnaB-like helicase C-terminal domain-containing protein [Actinomycetota bacterium]
MTLTGFTDLDRLTGGLSEGALVVLASGPYAGKTSLALSIVANVLRREPEPIYGANLGVREVRRAVALFSLQSTREQVVQRMVSLAGNLPVRDLRSGSVRAEDWPKLIRSVVEVSRAPLFVNDSAGLSLREMRGALEEMRRGLHGTDVELGLVVVDHLRLMLPPARSEDEREDHATRILRGLKILARDLRVPVLLLAQLPRGLERRHDKRPVLSDFEPSEPVDQFADTVLFLYRDELYDPDTDDKGIAEVIVAKHRDGPTGKVQLAFLEAFGRFASLARR